MKKWIKIPLIVLGVLSSIWTVARLTNIIQFYNSPTPANEPTIKVGSKFFASNLITPKLLNLICFYGETPEFGRSLRTFRVCGMAGDIVEIRNGDLFVNKKLMDDQIQIQHNYRISKTQYGKLENILKIDDESIIPAGPDTLIVPMIDSFALSNNLSGSRLILPKNYEDTDIFSVFSQHWNQDHFGPIKVPKDKYFVLGDNRQNAFDSRYAGFIDVKEVIGTVLWK